jgi:hypothetical protein
MGDGQATAPQVGWTKATPVTGATPQSAPAPAQTAPQQNGSGPQVDWTKATPVVGAKTPPAEDKPYNPAEHGAASRFGHAFAAPFKSMYHGATDEPQDVNEIVAHAQGGQGGLIAYRAAKKLMDAHTAMMEAKPSDAFRQAAFDFQNAAIDHYLGHDYDALMHGVSGGVSTIKGANPELGPLVLDRGRSITEGAASGGDLATPLGGVAADVAIAGATYGAGRAATAIRGAAEAGEAAEGAGATAKAAESAPKTNPIDTATSKAVSKIATKAGVPQGSPGSLKIELPNGKLESIEFSEVAPKDQVALKDLIKPNVKAGKLYGTNVDWKKALSDFDELPTEAQKARFSDPAAVRTALRVQATKQALVKAGLGTVGLGAIEELVRHALP